MATTSLDTRTDSESPTLMGNVNGGGEGVAEIGLAAPPPSGGGSGAGGPVDPMRPTDGIVGVSSLKGLLLYGATVAFVGLYAYFVVKIFGAPRGKPPTLDATTVSAAAALAGALGSAFALEIGAPTRAHEVNQAAAAAPPGVPPTTRVLARVRQALSLEPGSTHDASWPKTIGIWAYAAVASAVALTYVVNQHETPRAVQALALAFAGYVIALISAAYKAQGGE